jgi:hypothetical protein
MDDNHGKRAANTLVGADIKPLSMTVKAKGADDRDISIMLLHPCITRVFAIQKRDAAIRIA